MPFHNSLKNLKMKLLRKTTLCDRFLVTSQQRVTIFYLNWVMSSLSFWNSVSLIAYTISKNFEYNAVFLFSRIRSEMPENEDLIWNVPASLLWSHNSVNSCSICTVWRFRIDLLIFYSIDLNVCDLAELSKESRISFVEFSIKDWDFIIKLPTLAAYDS